jgi:alkanesulfonate monooxygenase SsuD/methylene tetrahydromethanopterin reductase-like flavin-dependent oxidoreductase (luciferase family)
MTLTRCRGEIMSETKRTVHPWAAAGTEEVRFAITCLAIPDHRLMRDEVRHLEGLGFDAVFLPDHPLAVMSDPWLTLAGCADATTSIRLGVMASCVAYRHPAMLARAVADVDRMSDGRAILGLGSGDLPHEFAVLGLDWGTPRARRERLEQTLHVMPRLLRGDPVTYKGSDFALNDAALPMPAPQEPHVPIVLAGGSRGSLRLAAEHADAVNLGAVAWAGGAFSAEDVTAKLAALDEFCASSGREPDSVLRTGFVGLSIAPTADEAKAGLEHIPPAFRDFFGGLFFAGNPDEVGMYLQKMITAGYQYIIFVTADVFAGSRMMTELLVSEVLPQLRERHLT